MRARGDSGSQVRRADERARNAVPNGGGELPQDQGGQSREHPALPYPPSREPTCLPCPPVRVLVPARPRARLPDKRTHARTHARTCSQHTRKRASLLLGRMHAHALPLARTHPFPPCQTDAHISYARKPTHPPHAVQVTAHAKHPACARLMRSWLPAPQSSERYEAVQWQVRLRRVACRWEGCPSFTRRQTDPPVGRTAA